MNTALYKEMVDRYGALPTLYHAAYRAANSVAKIAVWDAVVVTLDRLDKAILDDPRQAAGRMLETEEMRPYVRDPENLLTDAFLDEARPDRCHAFFEGETLTSYGWYATRPTRLTELDPSLVLHFDPAYVYMYNGYTRPKFRGQRLHALGMAAALAQYTREGKKGIVSYVDSSNFASLKSCFRMGYERFGRVAIVKIGERYVSFATSGCKEYDLYVETGAASQPTLSIAA